MIGVTGQQLVTDESRRGKDYQDFHEIFRDGHSLVVVLYSRECKSCSAHIITHCRVMERRSKKVKSSSIYQSLRHQLPWRSLWSHMQTARKAAVLFER